jgi:uncharacterized membrane protein YcaP (DUF421 family)
MYMEFYEHLKSWLGLGLEPKDLAFSQVTLRGVIVFIVSLFMVRFSDKRFLPHKTAFDAILFFILASMLSRAINGGAPFFPTLGVGFVLVGLHRLIAILAYHSRGFGQLVKGSEELLILNGTVMDEKLHKHKLTMDDLLEEMRLNGNVTDPKKIKEAKYERSGEISVVKGE